MRVKVKRMAGKGPNKGTVKRLCQAFHLPPSEIVSQLILASLILIQNE